MSFYTNHTRCVYSRSEVQHLTDIPIQIHASTINHDPEGRIRLGTDLRYVNSAREFDKVCLSYLSIKQAIANYGVCSSGG